MSEARRVHSVWLAAGLCVASWSLAPAPRGLARTEEADIDQARFLEHVRFLAADDLMGRGNGMAGLEAAADYIAGHLGSAGLQPGGSEGTYFQTFELVAGLQLSPGSPVVLQGDGFTTTLQHATDYRSLSLTTVEPRAGRTLRLPIVFVGHGMGSVAPASDDYSGIDVDGKAVLVFGHAPRNGQPAAQAVGSAEPGDAVMRLATEARSRGARLLMVLESEARGRPTQSSGGPPAWGEYGLPVLRFRPSPVTNALGQIVDLEQLHRRIHRGERARSRELPGVTVTLTERLTRARRRVRNVLAVVPGTDPDRAHEAVVVGAHYDHLGLGGRHSLSPGLLGQVHNGADDNASGIAAMLEIARVVATDPHGLDRSVVFAAFAGEELGLLGSTHYTNEPSVPLEDTVAMLNLDMIGRPNGRVMLSGLEVSPSLEPDVEWASADLDINVQTFGPGAGFGSSDDTSFLRRNVPALAFFSGFHEDYHRPGDDWEKIDLVGSAEVARLALGVLRRIADRDERPEFVRPDRAGRP